MLFNSEVFLIFALVFFPVYFLLRQRNAQNTWALLASYVFYGWWDWRFLFLIAASTLFNFLLGRRVAPAALGSGEDAERRRRRLVVLAVTGNLVLLGIFKYTGFFVDSFIDLLAVFGMTGHRSTLNIILPVGISFFTFQALSYVLDVSRGKLQPQQNLVTFGTFIALFPQLVAGPIVRAHVLLPQLETVRRFRWPNLWLGLEKIIIGAALKIVVADRLAPLVDQTFAQPGTYDGLGLSMGVLFFAFQIYGDFAGYSLMAIGLGRVMGLSFPANFKRPYLSVDFSDFWRRWHISLSSWLRDYLYIALGGNRGGPVKTYRNLSATMVLGGLWHGAGWNFIIWGTLHGAYLVVQRLLPFRFLTKPSEAALQRVNYWIRVWIARATVFSAVCVAWVFFRAETFPEAWAFFDGIWNAESFDPAKLPLKFQTLVGVGLSLAVFGLEVLYEDTRLGRLYDRSRVLRTVFALALVVALPLLGSFTSNAFIYFQF